MRRLRSALLAGVLVLAALPALALSGEEPGSPDFSLGWVETSEPKPWPKVFGLGFDTAEGWDFGDRAAYSCAWVEFFRDGIELFEVHFERVDVYPNMRVNDKYGVQAGDGTAGPLCAENGTTSGVAFDGSDHFPHHTVIDFYRDGSPLTSLDLTADECAKAYWTPGDEPGEAWLWWDADGPTNDGHHDLDCGGGPLEPEATFRAYVTQPAEGIAYCTRDNLDGDLCYGLDATGSATAVLSDGRHAHVALSVPTAVVDSCGAGTVTLADGREVAVEVCVNAPHQG